MDTTGEPQQISPGTLTRHREETHHHRNKPTTPTPLQQQIGTYITSRQTELAATSTDTIRSHLNQFAQHIGNTPITNITGPEIKQWANQGHSHSTKRGRLTSLRGFCDWLISEQQLDRNPCTGLRPPPNTKPSPPRYLEEPQLRRLGAAVASSGNSELADARNQALFGLLLNLGLRVIEASRLLACDVRWHDNTTRIRGKGGRGEVTRVLPMNAAVQQVLDDYLNLSPPDGPVFRTLDGTEPLLAPEIGRMVSRWMSAARLKTGAYDGVSAHALRHTRIQQLIDAGINIRDVQAFAGHSSVTTTETYIRRAVDLRGVLENVPAI